MSDKNSNPILNILAGDWIKVLTNLNRLPGLVVWLSWLFCGLFLFSPQSWMKKLSLMDLKSSYHTWFGPVFLGASLLLCLRGIGWVGYYIRLFYLQWRRKNIIRDELKNLDTNEQAVLREFIIHRVNSKKLYCDRPEVATLAEKQILQMVINAGSQALGNKAIGGMIVSYKLTPLGKKLLRPEWIGLSSFNDSDFSQEEIEWITANRPDFVDRLQRDLQIIEGGIWRSI